MLDNLVSAVELLPGISVACMEISACLESESL